MPAKNILIATGLYPPDIGGPATILKALVKYLRQADLHISVITYADKDHGQPQEAGVYRISKNKFYSRYHYLLKMMILAKKADLIYVTDTYSVGYFAYLLAKFWRKPYIVRFAGDSAWETATSNAWTQDYILDFQDKKYNEQIEKLKQRRQKILWGANKVIAVSHFMAELAKKIGVPTDKIKVIYNSVDFIDEEVIDERVASDIRAKFSGTGKIIVTAGRLVPWKGVAALIHILPNIIKQVGPVTFLVLGDGPELKNLQAQVTSLGMTEQVKFLGVVDHHQVVNYFKAADLFVLNTNYEGLSHTILEAMRAEVPIVTTDVGGNPELISQGRSGFLVDYNDELALEKAIVNLLTDQKLAAQFVKAAKEKLSDFNWDNTIAETVKLIKEI